MFPCVLEVDVNSQNFKMQPITDRKVACTNNQQRYKRLELTMISATLLISGWYVGSKVDIAAMEKPAAQTMTML